MARKTKVSEPSGYTVLIVDDNQDYLAATRSLLEGEGHHVLTTDSGIAALEILKEQKVDLMLLDYYMPGMTGEEVVSELRTFNLVVQIILQTGYVNEQPPRELLKRLDIQGYYDKSEGAEKLLLWTDVGLKAAYSVQLLTKSRKGLQYILDVTPDMHRIQSLNDLLQGILWQIAGLLGVVNSFLAVIDEGGLRSTDEEQTESFLAMVNDDTELVIRASTGRFAGHEKVSDVLDDERSKVIYETLQKGRIRILKDTTLVPLKVGDLIIGMIYLDRQVIHPQDQELLSVFSNQAAVAIQNSQLYELAAIDNLTGLYTRGFFEKWLYRELRTAFRSRQSLAFLMVDLDKLKQINDQGGHQAGDRALMIIGDVLRRATRSTDITARYGGDEFAIILPNTGEEGAWAVGNRIIHMLEEKRVSIATGELFVHTSVGISILEPHTFKPEEIPHPIAPEYMDMMSHILIRRADKALYESKQRGGDQVYYDRVSVVKWLPLAPMD
ncbi:MAG: diguanylate cyclase [Chloroflexi bacterium]|nr:diguanylate cyclase [Chloroflexota bacterium]